VKGAAGDNGSFDGGFGIFQLPGVNGFAAIHLIGDDGVLDMRQMDANLVGPACFGGELQKRESAETLENLVESDCLFAGFRADGVFISEFEIDA